MQELNTNIQRLNTEYYRKRIVGIELETYREGWVRAGRYLEAAVDLPEEWRILDMAQKVIAGLQMMGEDIKIKIFHSLAEGYTLGESIPKLARRIREISDSNRYRAIRFARTVTNSVYNQAHIDRYREAGIKYIQYHATLDARTTQICRHLHGTIWREGDPGIVSPPAHWNCRSRLIPWFKEYPGDRKLSNDITKQVNYFKTKYKWR